MAHFRGGCSCDAAEPRIQKREGLGRTHISNGRILPRSRSARLFRDMSAIGIVASRKYSRGILAHKGEEYSYDIKALFKETKGTGASAVLARLNSSRPRSRLMNAEQALLLRKIIGTTLGRVLPNGRTNRWHRGCAGLAPLAPLPKLPS